MKKKSLWLITALMTLALLGVFVMQLYYIKEAYKLKSQLFEQNVNRALNEVVNKVQVRNAANHISKKEGDFKIKRHQTELDRAQRYVDLKETFKTQEEKREQENYKHIQEALNYQDKLVRLNFGDAIVISEEEYKNLQNADNSGLYFDFNVIKDVNGKILSKIASLRYNPNRAKTFNITPSKLPDSIRYVVQDPRDLRPLAVSVPTIDSTMAKKFAIEAAMAKKRYQQALIQLNADTINLLDDNVNVLQAAYNELSDPNISLASRIPNKQRLNALLKNELANKGISLAYNFWIKLANKDSLLYQSISYPTKKLLPQNVYKFPLFGKDIIRDPGMLYIYFPNKSNTIIANMFATMASSAALLLILVFIFAYTIYTIIKQKKLSEMKTDFINNMTHEFKTPVATIMIASEALKDPEVADDKNRVSRFANIIYDENVRLGNHIERVLSIAKLENKEIELDFSTIHTHDSIVDVVDSMSLQLQKRNAKLTLELAASEDMVMTDELHFSNVIFNLIDNANKYSTNAPEIAIETYNSGENLIIAVSDKGIGMTKDQTKRIFDQFYRVPTGNLHDVKGFGLGLNYVHNIITQLGGKIKVHSEKDHGTTFEISLPFIKSN